MRDNPVSKEQIAKMTETVMAKLAGEKAESEQQPKRLEVSAGIFIQPILEVKTFDFSMVENQIKSIAIELMDDVRQTVRKTLFEIGNEWDASLKEAEVKIHLDMSSIYKTITQEFQRGLDAGVEAVANNLEKRLQAVRDRFVSKG